MNRAAASPFRRDAGGRGFRLSDDHLLTAVVGLALVLAAGFPLVVVAATWPDTPFLVDFVAFWSGGMLLGDGAGASLLDAEQQRAVQVALRDRLSATEAIRGVDLHYPFLNPPPLALLFVPLAVLPFHWAYIVWAGISFAGFAVSVALQLRGSSRGRGKAVALLAFGGVWITLLEGQINAVLLLAFSLSLLAFQRQRCVTGGALLGILWLKPQYALPFALLLLLKRRWRELTGMAGVGAGIGALSLAMVGPAGIVEYIAQLRRISAFRPPVDALVSPHAMVNWRAMLLNLWPDVPDGEGQVLVMLLGGSTILVALLSWRGAWEPASDRFPRQMLIVTLAAILASPHSHFHGAVLLLAPLAALLARPTDRAMPAKGWRTLLVGGLMLSAAVTPFASLRWLLAPVLLAGLGMLIAGRPTTTPHRIS